MTAEHARSSAPDARPRTQAYYKSGTIERFVKWRGVQDGKRLHYISKIIGVALLGHARSDRGFTAFVTEPDLCEELAMDPKTLRKYLQPLIEFGLLTVDRKREGAAKCYDCSPIYKRFGEAREEAKTKVTDLAQTRNASRTEQSGTASSSARVDGDHVPGNADAIPARPGSERAADRDGVPLSINERSSSSLSSSLLDVRAPAARLGIKETTGIELEIVTIDELLTRWGWITRFQRSTVKRYGVIRVAGAIGYVLEQDRLNPNTIESPGKLCRYALKRGFAADLPNRYTGMPSRSEPISESPPSMPSGIADALRTYLSERLSAPTYEAFLKHARFEFAAEKVTITCATSFAADLLRSRFMAMIQEAVEAVIGRANAVVYVTSDDGKA